MSFLIKIRLKIWKLMPKEANSWIDSTEKNTRDTKPTTFPPTLSRYITTTRREEQRVFSRLFDSSASTSILTAEREHFFVIRLSCTWQETLFRVRDRLHGVYAGSCPGTWSVAKRGKNKPSPAFRTVSKSTRSCSRMLECVAAANCRWRMPAQSSRSRWVETANKIMRD